MKNIEVPIDPNEEAEELLTRLNDGIARATHYGVPKEDLDSGLSYALGLTTNSSYEERICAINRIQGDIKANAKLRGLLIQLDPDNTGEDVIAEKNKRRMAMPLDEAVLESYSSENGGLSLRGKPLTKEQALEMAVSGNGEVREVRLLAHVKLQRAVSEETPDGEVIREVYLS